MLAAKREDESNSSSKAKARQRVLHVRFLLVRVRRTIRIGKKILKLELESNIFVVRNCECEGRAQSRGESRPLAPAASLRACAVDSEFTI